MDLTLTRHGLLAFFVLACRQVRWSGGPAGGYFVWFEFAEVFSGLALNQAALARGISVAPGPMFSARRHFRHCLRLNYGHPWDARFEAAMQTLGALAVQQSPYAASLRC